MLQGLIYCHPFQAKLNCNSCYFFKLSIALLFDYKIEIKLYRNMNMTYPILDSISSVSHAIGISKALKE